MKHTIKCSKISLNRVVCHVELIPENKEEAQAIRDVIDVNASPENHKRINEYLTQCILQKGYSPVDHIRTIGKVFEFTCI